MPGGRKFSESVVVVFVESPFLCYPRPEGVKNHCYVCLLSLPGSSKEGPNALRIIPTSIFLESISVSGPIENRNYSESALLSEVTFRARVRQRLNVPRTSPGSINLK